MRILILVFICVLSLKTLHSVPSFQDDQARLNFYEIGTLGAATTGALVEGVVGSIHKGCRHRFYCYSAGPQHGFLGPLNIAKPLSLKDQPGVFPAPLMGSDSLTFLFSCSLSSASFTPIIVRPDGTVFRGFPMAAENSPQTLVISSPAQTGIYTLFILPHQHASHQIQVNVDATVNNQTSESKTFQLNSFPLNHRDSDLVSAEFVYIPVR